MFVFKHGSTRAAQRILQSHVRSHRCYASKIEIPFAPPPFPVIESCPSPTCRCQETPPGLDIDRETSLNGSMGTYAEQVLISTGRNDWKSRIDEDEDAVFVRRLKSFFARGGKYSDPYHNVLLTNSSISATQHSVEGGNAPASAATTRPGSKDASIVPELAAGGPPASAFLVPSFQYVPSIPTDSGSVEAFIRAFVLPQKLHQMHGRLNREEKNILLRQEAKQRQFVGARKINEILILICGHGGRDDRCGILGPILQAEFEEKLQRQNIPLLKDPPVAEAVEVNPEVRGYSPTARVAMISHIGGHKFAGNVIIYIPPSFSGNSLAGKGIWYGRVGPEHVEGIVDKTVLGGKVIKDMFRGGIDRNGDILRL